MRWYQRFFRRGLTEKHLDAELRFHLEQQIAVYVAAGMKPEEAGRQARLEFGGLDQVKEECRDVGAAHVLESLAQDIRYGLRQLRRSPGFTAVALLTLALGIGANTAIFSMVNCVLLRPLGYREARQLYLVREIIPELSQTYPTLPANLPNFRVWQRDCHSFEEVALVGGSAMTLTGYGEAKQVSGAMVSSNVFHVLGIEPELGRTFLPEEDAPGKDHVVILTHAFWRARFNTDPGIVGRSLTFNGTPFQVVGVLPASFRVPKATQFGQMVGIPSSVKYFKPLGLDAKQFSPLGEFDYGAIARLRPGISPAQALAELNVIQARIAKQANSGVSLRAQLIPLEDVVVGTARRSLLLLLAGVGAILLIVCLNLANLLLVRAPARMREAGIRTALGASRTRMARQLLTESASLAILGGILGIGIAYLGVQWLVAVAPSSLPRLDEVHVDGRVLWFAAVVSLLTGIIFGTIPAWRVSRAEPQETLKASAITITESRSTRRLRQSLVGLEVTLGTLLLLIAGLLTTSVVRLLAVDKGFNAEHVLAVDVSLPSWSYTKLPQKERFYENVLAQARTLPGVTAAGWISRLPLQGQENVDDINVPGRLAPGGQAPVANYRYVSPGYFQAMGIQLRQGRLIEAADRDLNVALVSESVAQKIWPGENPLGKQFRPGDDERSQVQVIGVVADVRLVALDEPPLMMVYLPTGSPRSWQGSNASLVVRGAVPPTALAAAVRGAIRAVDSGVPITDLRPMGEIVSESVALRRFQMGLASLFASFALLLAALGIYGVVGYSVARRRAELGLRMALGAQVSDLRNLVLREGMSPVIVGWAAGVLASWAVVRLIRSLLFGVTALDPVTLASVTVVVLLSAVLACYLPAARATKVDPMVALRYE